MTKIYYFSGTGNTLWSAKKIAELSSDKSELLNIGIEAEKEKIVLEADAVVILFPAYAYGPPYIVRHFIQKAEFKTPYIAAFATYGSSPGGALAEIRRVLKRKGLSISYTGSIAAVENYIAIFGPPKPEIEKERLLLQQTDTEEVIRVLNERRKNSIKMFRPFSSLIYFLFSIALKIFYRWYRLGKDCNGCGICEKVCPVSAIVIKNGRPKFDKKCEHCQGCITWCPQRAINFGRITKHTPRYHHPGITINDIYR